MSARLGLLLALGLPLAVVAYPSFFTPISSSCTEHPTAAQGMHLSPKQDS
jgi:hypothetical protein